MCLACLGGRGGFFFQKAHHGNGGRKGGHGRVGGK